MTDPMTFLSKPTKEDARLMLQLEELLLMDPNQTAWHWFWRIFEPMKLRDRAAVRKAYPPGSEGQRYFDRISAFWESAGALVKNGLLNEKLFFDRFLVTPYWDALKEVIYADREDTMEPRIGENFEWLAMRQAKLSASPVRKSRKRGN
jgi:hypothetical protein